MALRLRAADRWSICLACVARLRRFPSVFFFFFFFLGVVLFCAYIHAYVVARWAPTINGAAAWPRRRRGPDLSFVAIGRARMWGKRTGDYVCSLAKDSDVVGAGG